ncbi:MAG: Na/Pi cotransporter family protein [Flavobacteriales bacterium]|jgi:phosphate:Na+ symporter|nr:Na/Pi cotransporter family protein [Flavobacteriales bacterium]
MEFGIWQILNIVGALGFFIYGMKVMSDALQQVAGSKMRQFLRKMTSNRFSGVATGFLITAILQSSSATTVMTVSFVNAGFLSLMESAGVMMGANIGTTITGWLVSLIGFEVKVSHYALPIIGIAFPFMFSSRHNRKKWAEVVVGFGLLFLGLGELKEAVPDIKNNPDVLNFLSEFKNPNILTRMMFVGVGTLLTIIVQSSSAAMALTITLTAQGLPIEIAAAMVLGENIGTTITAELASLVANVHAKRSARIHSLFNVIGVTWMLIAMPYVLDILGDLFPPPSATESNEFALAAFHTTFNFLNVLICVGFVKKIVDISIKTVKSKGEEDEVFKLKHIGSDMFRSPELSVEEAAKEVAHCGEITSKLFNMLPGILNEADEKKFTDKLKRIAKYEEITDRMEVEISDFLSQKSQNEMSTKAAAKTRSLLSIVSDLERIGDLVYQIAKTMERRKEKKAYFLPDNRKNIERMMEAVGKGMVQMQKHLLNPESINMEEAIKLENIVDDLRNELRASYLKKIQKGEYKIKSAIYYNDVIHSLEKIGDHVIQVSEAIAGDRQLVE